MKTAIGIVGGGQLAAMLADVCIAHETPCWVLDQNEHCPAVLRGASWIKGDSWDLEALERLAERVDVVTIEVEHIDLDNLSRIASQGKLVLPGISTLTALTNKLEQKKVLSGAGVPVSPFQPTKADTVINSPFGVPFVWKASRGGYDGRGVEIITSERDSNFCPRVDGFIEAHIGARMELSVMLATSQDNQVTTWSPVEMVFDNTTNILKHLISPARISPEIEKAARSLAIKAVHAVGGVGIFGVEMFLTDEDQLVVNEISPRTHNSGHVTMNASETSQFEQQFRILTNIPLGPTAQTRPAVMSNLLGKTGYSGKTTIENLETVDEIPNTYVHMYGKQECFPQRKMGHVTLTDDSIDSAMQRLVQIETKLIIRGAKPDA